MRGKAAEQGFANAQHYLGFMYEKGMGVPEDYIMAFMWLSLAKAHGDKMAWDLDIVKKI